MIDQDVGTVNSRRLSTPGAAGWAKGVRPDSKDRYFVATVDSHVSEPGDVFQQGGLDPKFYDRLPKVVIEPDGRHVRYTELMRPSVLMGLPKPGEEASEYRKTWERDGLNTVGFMLNDRMEPDDFARMKAASTKFADEPGLERMRADMDRDGVDAAVVFANRGIHSFFSHDPKFLKGMSRAWNTWARDTYKGSERFSPAAQVPTLDIDDAIDEVQWAAANGFRTINIPCKPLAIVNRDGEPQYNQVEYDRLWAAIEETGMPVCIHAATGRDPRSTSGPGGAIVNRAVGAFATQAMEPLALFLASGVFYRFPKLKLITVEADIGWIPWFLDALDGAYYRHHMWVRPMLKDPPSHAYRTNCASTFMEDPIGLSLIQEHNLVDNVMWTNDYPHHEGSWPHSPEAIERQLQRFDETERAKLLGLNAARIFGLKPGRYIGC